MGKLIEFLERVGSDATLRHADAATLEAALNDFGIDAETRNALLANDGAELHRLLGERPFIVSQMQFGIEDEETPDDDGADNDKDDDDTSVSRAPVADESR
jgi:hypothetical protein